MTQTTAMPSAKYSTSKASLPTAWAAWRGFLAWRSTHPLDVLIVDRQLPDGDGLEAVALHRQSSDSPVIVLTALGQLPERVAGMEADADYYLVKPVVMDELIALLRRLQRKQQLSESQYWTVSAGFTALMESVSHSLVENYT